VKVLLLAVGKPRDANLAAAIAEYESRAARYWPFEAHEVREESARGLGPELVREREGERLAARLPGGARLVACDATGTSMTSERFADWLRDSRDRAQSVAFVIGGAFGLAPALRQRADMTLSFAPWTLPHELARLVLAEQIYRAGTILRGEPYHK
jgi:23S rRNA (pseudouridine1915-N3)-methyltransferase